jgi:integrase
VPLTDVKIRQAKPAEKAYKLTDSGGLYLEVKPTGSKLWRYRYRIADKENLYAIGSYPEVSLVDARRERDAARELVKQGNHPAHVRQLDRAKQIAENTNTFEAVSREWIEKKRATSTPYYLKQIESGMRNDVWPYIGRRPLRSLTAHDFLQILQRVSGRGAATVAINLRQWCGAIMRYGVATLRADHDPLAALRGAVERPTVEHAQAMSEDAIADFIRRLKAYGGMRTTQIAMWLMLYTWVRTVEMRRGEWDEVDLERSSIWTIPAHKMKKRRIHLVPLPRQAHALLVELKRITGGGRFMFPSSRRPDDMISATTINRALEYLGVPFTGHDFRATASTHMHEKGWDSQLVEMQLAHAEQSKTKAAYNHAQHMDERRRMMQEWADWIDQLAEEERHTDE